jgi:hypothetical protein
MQFQPTTTQARVAPHSVGVVGKSRLNALDRASFYAACLQLYTKYLTAQVGPGTGDAVEDRVARLDDFSLLVDCLRRFLRAESDRLLRHAHDRRIATDAIELTLLVLGAITELESEPSVRQALTSSMSELNRAKVLLHGDSS